MRAEDTQGVVAEKKELEKRLAALKDDYNRVRQRLADVEIEHIEATEAANFPLLAASVLVMSAVVVLFNRLVWRRLYDLAERRFTLSK